MSCLTPQVIIIIINPLESSLGIEGHAALDRNLQPGYNTLLLPLIQRYLDSECRHRNFHTLPSLSIRLHCLTPTLCFKQGGSLYHFYGLWYDLAGAQTHDLLHVRWIR